MEGKRSLTDYAFPAHHGSKPYVNDVRGALAPMELLLGYPVMPHDLRRSFITVAKVSLDGDMRQVDRQQL